MQFDPQVALGLDWRKLLEEEHQRRRYDWASMARPKQLPPPGNWSVFVLMAGRGAGKTRTGAEYIRMLAKAGNHGRIAIIGPTAADVRDVMIEGESGILAISPPDFSPAYEPSKRQLTWPNGVIGKLYSGEEPDRLRGPQHHAGWCLAGDTKIRMADGTDKAISEVIVGEFVATRVGPKVVTTSAMTNHKAECFLLRLVDGRTILGTAEHPVWIDGKGFTPLSSISGGMSVCAISASSGAGNGGTSKTTAITSPPSGCIERFGRLHTARSLPATKYTTRTTTNSITRWAISSFFQSPSTRGGTSRKKSDRIASLPCVIRPLARNATQSFAPAWLGSAHCARQSIRVQQSSPVLFARMHALSGQGAARSRARTGNVPGAQPHIPHVSDHNCTARSGAIQGLRRTERHRGSSRQSNAPTAGSCSLVQGQTPDFAGVAVPVTSTVAIASVEQYPLLLPVYNLTVEGEHEYFANGILTHNCDEIAAWEYPETWTQFKLGFRLGTDLRCIVTSTPKPCAVIRELVKQSKQNPERVVIVRGSTYENRANLAPEFFEDIIRQYEGTRLGRQELDGELLEDTPGALWNTVILDRTRCKEEPPEMVRIVVAVDPSVTSSEDSDECGMVVCGKGVDGDAYVLADLSGVMSPHEWAMKAVAAYHEWSADCIIAETNNGGDLVGNTILAVDPSVPFRKVTASRGKVARAEPVSALFEQNRAHLVGS